MRPVLPFKLPKPSYPKINRSFILNYNRHIKWGSPIQASKWVNKLCNQFHNNQICPTNKLPMLNHTWDKS